MKKIILLSFLLAGLSPAHSRISAVVLDANSHREISGVNVYIANANVGAVTDKSGTFNLDVPENLGNVLVTFRHISYDIQTISIDSLKKQDFVYLVPRIIPLPDIQIVGQSATSKIEIQRDIPQRVKVLDAKKFAIRGYTDAGDFLKTETSVQVDEELSGKKTVSIRGGNADDVVMLYNGVRMNSPLDNVFDFSLVDLENLERFEIIKGSNTSLYGPEAFSGVINVVPQIERDYTLRAQYRLGTYNTENLNLQVYKKLGPQHLSYSYKDASQRRRFVDAASNDESITNIQQHHNANIYYDIGGDNALNLMFNKTDLEYKNGRDMEDVAQSNAIGSIKYTGALGPVRQLNMLAAYKGYDEQQNINYFDTVMQRDIDDQALQFDVDKTFSGDLVDLLLGYNLKRAQVDFLDQRTQDRIPVLQQNNAINRMHHGFVGIVKTQTSAGAGFLQDFHIDFSVRHDNVHDDVSGEVEMDDLPVDGVRLDDNAWQSTHFKFSTSVDGYRENLAMKAFLNFGSNTKFPTVVQQLSVPYDNFASGSPLTPEQVTSSEVGIEFFKESAIRSAIDGWHAEGVLFRNYYTDKFRPFSSPGIPVVFYDNVPTAEIFGLEGRFNVYLLKKKLDIEYGIARYMISEKSAFPFKSDFKQTLDLAINHAGFSIQIHWFYENEQVGWIRSFDGGFAQVSLEPFSNVDLHISRAFRIGTGKIFINLSGRNLLQSDETVLQGLAIRDRRAYLTVGTQL